MKEDLVMTDVSEKDTEAKAVSYECEGFPEQGRQKEIISSIDTECTCTYALSKLWHRKWEEYVGLKGGSPQEAEVRT